MMKVALLLCSFPAGWLAMAAESASCGATSSSSCGAASVRGSGLLQGKQQMSRLSEERLGRPESVNVTLDGRSAIVASDHKGERLTYELEARSVFAPHAILRVRTDEGDEDRDVGPGRTFVSREKGRQVAVRIDKDKAVTGTFQVGDQLHQLRPDASLSMLEEGAAGAQLRSAVATADISGGSDQVAEVHAGAQKLVTTGGQSKTDKSQPSSKTNTVDDWAGLPFFGGGACYANDDMEHTVNIGIYADYAAVSSYGGDVEAFTDRVEELVSEINLMTVNQLHLRFEIVNMVFVQSEKTSRSYWGDGCDLKETTRMNSLGKDDLMRVGEAHSWLLTSCPGSVGMVYPESFCGTKKTNVVSFVVSDTGGYLGKQQFGYGLGITLGGDPTESGGNSTHGGIMYRSGNGEIDGTWQFDITAKSQICPFLDSKLGSCRDQFIVSPPSKCPGMDSVRVQTRKMGRGNQWQITMPGDGAVLCEGGKDTPYYDDAVFEEACCLDDGEYKLMCESPFADGWHGGGITIDGTTYCGVESSWRYIAVTFVLGATPTPAPPPCPEE